MDFIRQRLITNSSDRKPGIPANTGFFLLLYALLCNAHAEQPDTRSKQNPYVYAVQLESSRKPNLNDYNSIRDLGTIYTYQGAQNKGLTRVRIGYYTSRKSAARIQKKIRVQGFPDAYITKVRNTENIYDDTLSSENPAQILSRKPPQKNTDITHQDNVYSYIIQLESSYRPNLADYDRIRQYGPVYTKKDTTGRNLTYVRMGNYNSHAAARQMLEKVRAEGFNDAYIIRTRQTAQSTVQERTIPTPPRPADKKIKAVDEIAEQTNTISAHLYTIHVDSTDNPDMENYETIRQYGVVYMSYRYSRQSAEKEAGKDQIRIMAGYYENRPEAEEALEKIKAAGFKNARILHVPDRSRINRNIRGNIRTFTRQRPKPASETNTPSDDDSGTATKDPFTPLERLDADPFELR